jgi:two-component system, OmpR family, phosphate regulon sensor histidine kinase PhoR
MGKLNRAYPSLRTHLIGMLGVFVAIFLGLTTYLYFNSRTLFTDALQLELRGDLNWMSATLQNDPSILSNPARADSICKAIAKYKGFRVTLIDASGQVLADSHVPLQGTASMENHLARPEVKMALEKGWGHAWRYSSTIDGNMLYLAHKDPNQTYYLRMAAGPITLNSFQMASLRVFLLFLLLFVGASLIITWWISRKISAPLLTLQDIGENGLAGPLNLEKPPRWEAEFLEAEVLNQAFQSYVDQIRKLGGEVESQRDKLISVLNQLQEGILILSAEGKVLAVNPAAFRFLGTGTAFHRASDWLGQALSTLLPRSPLIAWLASAHSAERTPFMHLNKGPDLPFDLVCHLAPLGTGVETSSAREYLLTLMDVSEFRHLDRIKSEFVANASHELKTPLSSIKGYAETLIEGAINDAIVRGPFVGKIHSNALRLERLVQDLLSLSHLEANATPKESEPLPLRGYANAAANLHRQELESLGIRFENHIPEQAHILMEARDLELILNNLVGNAIKYNKPGGKIKLWLDQGENIKLSIKDTGIGIPTEMIPRIFERFYRAGSSRASKEGTGLGLAIVKHACHKYGISVIVESTIGEGSRFEVNIPQSLFDVREYLGS